MGIKQNTLAVAIGIPPCGIYEIVHDKCRINTDTALRLGRCFGVTAQFYDPQHPLRPGGRVGRTRRLSRPHRATVDCVSNGRLAGRVESVSALNGRVELGFEIASQLVAWGTETCITHLRVHDEDNPWGYDDPDLSTHKVWFLQVANPEARLTGSSSTSRPTRGIEALGCLQGPFEALPEHLMSELFIPQVLLQADGSAR